MKKKDNFIGNKSPKNTTKKGRTVMFTKLKNFFYSSRVSISKLGADIISRNHHIRAQNAYITKLCVMMMKTINTRKMLKV